MRLDCLNAAQVTSLGEPGTADYPRWSPILFISKNGCAQSRSTKAVFFNTLCSNQNYIHVVSVGELSKDIHHNQPAFCL